MPDQHAAAAENPAVRDPDRVADRLAKVLSERYSIYTTVHTFVPGEAMVSVYTRLVARTDGQVIWWRFTKDGRPMLTWAKTLDVAAKRISGQHTKLRAQSANRLAAAVGTAHGADRILTEAVTRYGA